MNLRSGTDTMCSAGIELCNSSPEGCFIKQDSQIILAYFQEILFHKGGVNKSDLSNYGNVSLQNLTRTRLVFRIRFMSVLPSMCLTETQCLFVFNSVRFFTAAL